MNHEEVIIAQRGWLARLLFGSITLGHHANKLLITQGNNEKLVTVSDLTEPVQLVEGFFWSKLILRTGTDTLIYGGFPKAVLAPLVNSLNIRLRLYAQELLESECTPLYSVVREIAELLSQQYYVRDSRRRQLVDAAQQAIAVEQSPFWQTFATPSQREALKTATQFIHRSGAMIRQANDSFVKSEMRRYQRFFDTIEQNPLTLAQRQACIRNEDCNRVLAGAGTGKTSTLIGRAGYLLASGQAKPEEILMLAFARKAMEEMQERQDKRLSALLSGGTPTIKTFHALGLDIIGQVEGKRPNITRLAEDEHAYRRFIDRQLAERIKDGTYGHKVLRFLASHWYPYRNPFDFDSMEQYRDYVRRHELRTLRGEIVKSFEECEIANFLFQHGVDYCYEAPYFIDTAGPDYRQYKPDFFLPEHNIYIEHFALDAAGQPPPHFDQQRYLKGICWKRDLHRRHGTTLLETYSYLRREGRLLSHLEESLKNAGVQLRLRPVEELLDELREQGYISELASLLSEFLALYKQSYLTWSQLRNMANEHRDAERLRILLEIARPIYEDYQQHLEAHREIDFADMIGKAIDYVETGRFCSPYTHILVDEFQDISPARARLIKALLRQRPECVLFVVGDDWQSIYRFTGSDIRLIQRVDQMFGTTADTTLDITFRFNNQIGSVASKFILKNPAQIRKSIRSHSQVEAPAVSLVRTLDSQKGLRLALNAIRRHAQSSSQSGKASVLVLARYKFLLEEWDSSARRQLAKEFPTLAVTFMTVHSAKGKEADYVVVLGLVKGVYGFPSEKPEDAILELLRPEQESFPFAEERRLFYVALTRARHRVYLVYNPLIASDFIKELINRKEGYSVCTDEFGEELVEPQPAEVPCPQCSGNLIPKQGKHGVFIGCNNYPYCKYTERPCPQCGSPMRDMMQSELQQHGQPYRFKVCTNSYCDGKVPLCPRCGGWLVQRTGRYGPFWGCINYQGDSDLSCTFTTNTLIFPKGEPTLECSDDHGSSSAGEESVAEEPIEAEESMEPAGEDDVAHWLPRLESDEHQIAEDYMPSPIQEAGIDAFGDRTYTRRFSHGDREYWVGYHSKLGLLIYDPEAQNNLGPDRIRLFKVDKKQSRTFITGLVCKKLVPCDETYLPIMQKAVNEYALIRAKQRATYCYSCGRELNSMDFSICETCRWIKCTCGACGCQSCT